MKKSLLTFLLWALIFWNVYAEKTFHVMAPLHVQVYYNKAIDEEKDWELFARQLVSVKSIGVDSVTTDVWWGLVETQDNVFDWSYYDKLIGYIEKAGLRWVPILSFHQCGGNVGDDYTMPIPRWIWPVLLKKYRSMLESEDDLKYKSEKGPVCNEYVSLWADFCVLPQYREFMDAFKEHYGDKVSFIEEVNISLGPSGELRYPSYNSHDGGGWPERGYLQCYSSLAVKDFRKAMKKKYGIIKNVNSAWNTDLKSFDEISPPTNGDYFFTSQDYIKITYGKDFIDWYNQALIDHGNLILKNAMYVFGAGEFKDVEIGFKIPGVHWRMGDPAMPRVAEVTAGLIRSTGNQTEKEGYGYVRTLQGISEELDLKRLAFYFTCLEMDNENSPGGYYSRAKDLVFWVGAAAVDVGLTVKGENALSGGMSSTHTWNNINDVFKNSTYEGLTILRVEQVSEGTGKEEYGKLISIYSK